MSILRIRKICSLTFSISTTKSMKKLTVRAPTPERVATHRSRTKMRVAEAIPKSS
jgi:hypothetical protein